MGISYGFGKFLISVTMNITNYVWHQKILKILANRCLLISKSGGGGGDFIPEPCRIFVGFTFSFIFLHFLNPFELARGGFRLTDPKNVLKAPLAPKSNNFEGEARAEKAQFFWPEFSKKCLKAPFWDCFFFFKILPAAQNIWPKQCLFFSAFGELGKSIWST